MVNTQLVGEQGLDPKVLLLPNVAPVTSTPPGPVKPGAPSEFGGCLY